MAACEEVAKIGSESVVIDLFGMRVVPFLDIVWCHELHLLSVIIMVYCGNERCFFSKVEWVVVFILVLCKKMLAGKIS